MNSSQDYFRYIGEKLAEFFKNEPEKIVVWLFTPNPHFGGAHPAWLMSCGREAKVAAFIDTQSEGW